MLLVILLSFRYHTAYYITEHVFLIGKLYNNKSTVIISNLLCIIFKKWYWWFQDIREHWERKLVIANDLYLELSAAMLQLEQREKELLK